MVYSDTLATEGRVSRARIPIYAQARHCVLRITQDPRLRRLELARRHTKLEQFGERSREARAAGVSHLRYKRSEDEGSGNVLLEPELFVVSVRLCPLFKTFVLGEDVVRAGKDGSVGPE